ncbi:MAG: aldehyde dehydrogenase [Acidimicrobiia bacterium]|nr:aldehyde dehydrogenase [Acidimicrobiia bacterium]
MDLLIGGTRAPSSSGAILSILEPATGLELTTVASGDAADVELAIRAARDSFDAGVWAGQSATARGRVLLRVAALIREDLEDIATLEARNAGKPIGDARWEVNAAAGVFEYYAGAANKIFGETIPVQDAGIDMVLREPVGVCALIVPWNFPLLITTWKTAPALACGNSVIIKPASLTPLTALRLGEILVEAGVPAGCVSVLPGPGRVIGDALVSDRRVDKIGFTGETTTGASILRASSENITRVSLELGGKSACVVFADADWEKAAAETPMSVFANTGQDCCARSRIVVEDSIYDDFVAAFTRATESLQVGTPLDETTEIGPMISTAQRQVSLDYLDIAAAEGAERVTGGIVPDDPGFYLSPAVLAGVDNAMRVAQEEIFGPVASIIPFRDEADAIRIANDTPYGLSGSIWTRDLGRAIRTAKAIRTGVLSVNTNKSVRTEAPFGGYKHSGLGRELGMHAMHHYTEVKNLFLSSE